MRGCRATASLESVLHMPDLTPPTPDEDADRGEPHLLEAFGETWLLLREVLLGHETNLLLLARRNGLQRFPETRPPS